MDFSANDPWWARHPPSAPRALHYLWLPLIFSAIERVFGLDEKHRLRARLRRERRDHVAALPRQTRALVFMRPPGVIVSAIPEDAVVGLYHPIADEAPTRAYAKFLSENGRRIALPWFATRDTPMSFRHWRDPYGDEGLQTGPYNTPQPAADAEALVPDVVFVPLLGFTADGGRLGQGGGHYDRWLAAHPGVLALGLAWDCQLLESLPLESHDHHLDAVITPTRLYQRPD